MILLHSSEPAKIHLFHVQKGEKTKFVAQDMSHIHGSGIHVKEFLQEFKNWVYSYTTLNNYHDRPWLLLYYRSRRSHICDTANETTRFLFYHSHCIRCPAHPTFIRHQFCKTKSWKTNKIQTSVQAHLAVVSVFFRKHLWGH